MKENAYEWRERHAGNFLLKGRVAGILLLCLLLGSCAAHATVDASADTGGRATATASTSRQTPHVQSTAGPQSTVGAHSVSGYAVKVYFSRLPQSIDDASVVFPVERISPTSGVSTFAVQQLMVGPNAAESAQGYVSEIKNMLTGPSSCLSGAASSDFTLSLNTKGATSQVGTATLKFCRRLSSPGVGADARALAEINATLKQFPTITRVVVLTMDAHCMGDESGMDVCLR